jgi:NTP pyrophosphatase (non-canonical NTP hydrolase)
MHRLRDMARGYARRFPEGNDPFQMVTRLLEECGEVASEVNRWEDSGLKRQKHGEPSKAELANEIRQALVALVQIAAHYGVEEEIDLSIASSLARMRAEGLID